MTVRLLIGFALLSLTGCETLNDAMVRRMFWDGGVSRSVERQILDGLERREKVPAVTEPGRPAPPELDRG